jgi:hypothetical protein
VTRLKNNCLGCGAPASGLVQLCSRCAELVGLDRSYPLPANSPVDMPGLDGRQQLAEFLAPGLTPGPLLLTAMMTVLVGAALLCQAAFSSCRWLSLCLLT